MRPPIKDLLKVALISLEEYREKDDQEEGESIIDVVSRGSWLAF